MNSIQAILGQMDIQNLDKEMIAGIVLAIKQANPHMELLQPKGYESEQYKDCQYLIDRKHRAELRFKHLENEDAYLYISSNGNVEFTGKDAHIPIYTLSKCFNRIIFNQYKQCDDYKDLSSFDRKKPLQSIFKIIVNYLDMNNTKLYNHLYNEAK